MVDWSKDAIVPSVAHGAAAYERWATDYKDVLTTFITQGDVAAAQENGRAGQIARIDTWRAGRPDQPAAERYQPAVAARVARHEFARQAGALGEAQEDNPLSRDTCCRHLCQHVL